jgi:ABC-type xylose transport system permease subunit
MGTEWNANNNVDVVVGQNDRPGSRVFDLERAGVTSVSYVARLLLLWTFCHVLVMMTTTTNVVNILYTSSTMMMMCSAMVLINQEICIVDRGLVILSETISQRK